MPKHSAFIKTDRKPAGITPYDRKDDRGFLSPIEEPRQEGSYPKESAEDRE